MPIEKAKFASEAENSTKENPSPMPNNHPKKQGLFTGISDALRSFSENIGLWNILWSQEREKKPNKLQEFFAKILGIFQGINIEKGVTIRNAGDVDKVREAFRPIINLDDTAIEFKKWDFIKYNKELGTVDFYPADSTQESGHSTTPTGIVPIDNPSKKVQQAENKRSKNHDEEPPIQWAKNHKWETAFSRLIWENVRPHKSGPDSCGLAVRKILESFGMKNPPHWHGNQWYSMLKNDSRFEYVPVNSLSEIPAGAILTYNGKWKINGKSHGSPMNRKYGHVEIKSSKGLYTSYYASSRPGGSAKAPSLHNNFEKWKEATGFTGAFIPLAKNKTDATEARNNLKNSTKNTTQLAKNKTDATEAQNNLKNSTQNTTQLANNQEAKNTTKKSAENPDFFDKQLSTLKQKWFKNGEKAIIVSAKTQTAYIVDYHGNITKNYTISTSAKWLGNEGGSQKTPTGTLKIKNKIGAWQPKLMSFIWQEPKWVVPLASKDTTNDAITSRILTLSGFDKENKNAGQRKIYFHGTNEEFLLGTPASHGCIRMKNDDIIEMFNIVSTWTYVQIA